MVGVEKQHKEMVLAERGGIRDGVGRVNGVYSVLLHSAGRTKKGL